MQAYKALGKEYVDNQLFKLQEVEGKSVAESRALISKEALEKLAPLKKRLGKEYNELVDDGYSYDDLNMYVQYQDEWKKEQEDAAYAKEAQTAQEAYKKDNQSDDFTDRLSRGVGRVYDETATVLSYVNPLDDKIDAKRLGEMNAREELGQEYKKKNRTPEQQKTAEIHEKEYADAEGTIDTVLAGSKILYDTVSNPSEWDMAGVVADFVNPVNVVGGGAGAVAAKVASKAATRAAVGAATRAAVGAATGAAVEGGLNAGYEYALSKGKGDSDKEAEKSAILGGFMGAGMGGVTGAGAGLLVKSNKVPGQKPNTDDVVKPVNSSDALLGKEEVLSEITLPEELLKSALIKLNKVEEHSTEASNAIRIISKEISDPVLRDAEIAKRVPPTEVEADYSMIINNGQKVDERLAGRRVRDALMISMQSGTDTVAELNAKLQTAGFNEESRAAIVDAYSKKDLRIYDAYVGQKYAEVERQIDANRRDTAGTGNGNTPKQESGTDSIPTGTGETTLPNTEPSDVPRFSREYTANKQNAGQGAGDNSAQTTVPTQSSGVEGQRPVRVDDSDVYGAGEKPVVQTKKSVDTSKTKVVSSIVTRAKGRVGTPYVWGGTNIEKGADCSGFIQSLHGEKGIALPRTAWGQAKSHKGIDVAYGDMKIGDVIYFKPSKTGKKYAPVTHTGLITGFSKDGTPIMTHAKGKNFGVVTEPLSKKYQGRFYSAKRYVNGKDQGKADVIDERNTYDRYEDLENDIDDDVNLLRDEREDGWDDVEVETAGEVTDFEDVAPLLDKVDEIPQHVDFEPIDIPSREKAIEQLQKSKNGTKITHVVGNLYDEKVLGLLKFKKDVPVRRQIENSNIKHIFKNHGNQKTESSRGLVAVNKTDIANYPEMVRTADFQTILTYKNGKRKMVSVRQSKGHYVVVEEVSTKNNTLTLKTMYKKKGNISEESIGHILEDESHLLTSRNDTVAYTVENMPSSTKSIAKDLKKVKESDAPEKVYTKDYMDGVDGNERFVDVGETMDDVDASLVDAKDVLFGNDSDVPLSTTQMQKLDAIDDPIKRHRKQKEFEQRNLKDDKQALKAWEKENLDKDGNIKKIGEC